MVPALSEPGRAWSPVPVDASADDTSLTGVREPIPYAGAATHVITTVRAGDDLAAFVIADPD